MPDGLGDRMKAYEARETGRRFLPGVPVVARIDGRAFSRFTKPIQRPYDPDFMTVMHEVTRALVQESDALIGYTQSDEISLVYLADQPDTQIFFDGKPQKMCSVLAAYATAQFLPRALSHWPDRAANMAPHFDARVFQVPNREEAANCLLWRELDATKNAISMAARARFSHTRLHGKSGAEMQEMLWKEAGINFNDYAPAFKRGAFFQRRKRLRHLSEQELARIPEPHRPTGPVERTDIARLEMPRFSQVANRAAVIFDGAEPEVRSAPD